MGNTNETLIKKEKQSFLIYKEIQSGAVAKSYMRKGFLIYEEMRKYFPIYEEAVRHIPMTLKLLHSFPGWAFRACTRESCVGCSSRPSTK